MCTIHKPFIGNARAMNRTESNSVDIVVTSPPYPMIEMWDECFSVQDPAIGESIESDPDKAFELMHKQMDEVWKECYRVLKECGFLCINIGDATRTINGKFKLYNKKKQGKEVKHFNKHLDSPVMTKQEEEISFNYITSIRKTKDGYYKADYESVSDMRNIPYQLLMNKIAS